MVALGSKDTRVAKVHHSLDMHKLSAFIFNLNSHNMREKTSVTFAYKSNLRIGTQDRRTKRHSTLIIPANRLNPLLLTAA